VPEQKPAAVTDISPSATLADKIEWLIQNMWPADAPPPKNNVEAAAAITEATGEDISSTTVWKLRTGRQDNPQLRTLTALATFFGVPIGYFGFATEAEPIDDDLTHKALLRELQAGTVSHDVLRALVDLSPDVRWVVDEMILAASGADRRRRGEQRPVRE
jgi:transcriptional regulator with XRE-family HTH domain